MASIYIHFPFCKSRCIYCDFFSTTFLSRRRDYVDAVKKELECQRDFFGGETIKTVYLGGGTPSQMDVAMLEEVFQSVFRFYDVDADAEITMECNPDDLTEAYVEAMRSCLPVNRVSMGVQTFDDTRLAFLRRRHTALVAEKAVERCRKHGYDNLSIDLIYGFPGETVEEWETDIDKAVAMGVEHLSAYSLMYEEGTPLYRMREAGQVIEADEEESVGMYRVLTDKLAEAGYRHYEISNYCRPGFHSRHNSGYWDGTHYLGIGAGAHSYNGLRREWNEDSLDRYLGGVLKGNDVYRGGEDLDGPTRFNEMLMTALRTSAGVNLDEVERRFGSRMKESLLAKADHFIRDGLLEKGLYVPIDSDDATGDESLHLTCEAVFTSNGIISELFL